MSRLASNECGRFDADLNAYAGARIMSLGLTTLHRPRATLLGLQLVLGVFGPIAAAQQARAEFTTFKQIADAYAGTVVDSGQAVGIGVVIVEGNHEPRYFTYGNAVTATSSTPAKPFMPDSLWWMGSVSKVFTFNLLGQRIYTGDIEPKQPLSDFSAQIGPMMPLTSQMSIKQLASFTGGLLDTPPPCTVSNPPPGCPPHPLSSLQEWPVKVFAEYVQQTVPMNFKLSQPKPVHKLPAPWFYSNYSAALTGLLIGGKPGELLNNSAVRGWFGDVRRDILKPLGMDSTYLWVPASQSDREAGGYVPAVGTPVLANGQISAVNLVSAGDAYPVVPEVRVLGGGGTGAQVVAMIGPEHRVTGFKVIDGGSGYVPPPVITFQNGGGTKAPFAEAITSGGKVVGVKLLSGGEGVRQVPDVNINGGQPNGGTWARLEAVVAGGQVVYVRVVEPGSGYVDRLSVAVAPGNRTSFPVSPMAPAGFLVSTLEDMAAFTRAAIAKERPLDPQKALIREGFKISERQYVCTQGNPKLKNCPPATTRSGFGWMIHPGFDRPDIISKDGGIPGYSTFVTFMPDRGLGVAVNVNTRPLSLEPAISIGEDILDAIYYDCGKQGDRRFGCD
jgi:CubicO group peptidase (beta-lactamase class C family)